MGERVQGTHGRRLLGRVAGGAVVLRKVGHHHLRVALGAEGARLEQGLAKVHTPAVHVEARVDVVERVHHHVQSLPEIVVEHFLGVGGDTVLQRIHIERTVDSLGGVGRAGALRLADVPIAEEELPREVGLLNDVVVSDGHLAVSAAGQAHERKVLDELAAKRAGADQENLLRLNLALDRLAEARNLRVVPVPLWRELGLRERLLRGEGLDRIEVEPLVQRVELAGARLDNLLTDDAAEHGAHRGEVPSRRLGKDGEDAVGVHVVDLSRRRRGVVDILGAGHHRGGVGVATRGREPAVLHGKRVERVEAHVEDGAAVQLGEIGQQEFARILHRGREGLEGELLGLLHLRGDTPAGVLAVRGGILLELERVSLDIFNPPRDSVVELRHALYLGEENPLAVLELHALIIHARDQRGGVVGDGRDDAGVGLLAIHVQHVKAGAEVAEERAKDAANVATDERDAVCVAEGVDILGLRQGNLGAHDDRVLLAEVVGDLAGVDGDGDGGIEFLELGRARLGAVLVDVGLGEVKLRAQIGELARGAVLDGDTLDPREDDVLGDLRAQAFHAADEDGGARQLPHALAAVNRELTGVEILIDLARRGHRVVRSVSRALLLRVRLLCLGVSFGFSLSSRR
mmetsp:Transcript_3626/g.14809  ORF Transcript_3626/g.14809 Transcript_3626/m.14809 type:complete len:630 (+) Transcript_3626:2928-4817(+)